MIYKFSRKIVEKEWKKLLLPFLSVILTATVVSTSFFIIDSAKNFLTEKNKEFLGGDISYQSSSSFELDKLIDKNLIDKVSNQITFSGVLNSSSTDKFLTTNASFKFVDENFPIYGELKIKEGELVRLKEDEIYIDETIAKGLNSRVGDIVIFNNQNFKVMGIISEDPENLLSGFNFLGKVILDKSAVGFSQIDLNLFKKDFLTKVKVSKPLSKVEIENLKSISRENKVRASFDSAGQSGFQFGLEVVERFLVVAILIICILSLVNIYASVNYLANRLRRSFAILISIGMNIKNVYKILFVVNFLVIFIGTLFGLFFGYYLTSNLLEYVNNNYSLKLNLVSNILEIVVIFLSILLTSIFATIPVLNRLRKVSPKELLSHSGQSENKNTRSNIFIDVFIGILPITFLAIYFLESYFYGLLAVSVIVFTYVFVMISYYYFINFIYKYRVNFSFSVKMILAQKKFDGFFGLISFASLFVALTAVYNLSIIRTSLEDYLRQDLARTLPSVYILDIQNSQKENLLSGFPEVTLFPNIRARILQIDDVDIQKKLAEKEVSIDRELGREFNLTYRNYLLPSEVVSSGKFLSDSSGEVSVEKDFAKRANIVIGSKLKFLIQGFTVEVKVTSLREVDTRSGYPFFYFILAPQDIEKYPGTYFGYANLDEQNIEKIATFLGREIPNATLINTSSITKVAENLINLLLVIIFIITIPPLVLSSLLIITILTTLAKERKRDGARLMALGKTHSFVRNYYIVESASTTIIASAFAYLFALLLSNFVIIKYLKIDNLVYFDFISFYIFIFILFGIIVVSIISWRSGNKSLRDYLNYEENN
jgi:putative ABC transport system permease protein